MQCATDPRTVWPSDPAAAPTAAATAAQDLDVGPAFVDTYALTYAAGIFWLFVSLAILGTQKQFSFTPAYDLTLALAPFATAVSVLLLERRGSWLSQPLRLLILLVPTVFISGISTIVLTPLLAMSFRVGITGNLGLTGKIAAVILAAVMIPVFVGLVRAVRARSVVRISALAVGLVCCAIALVMAIDATGPVASLMRLDQARVMMVALTWWLPIYAAVAGVIRRSDLA